MSIRCRKSPHFHPPERRIEAPSVSLLDRPPDFGRPEAPPTGRASRGASTLSSSNWTVPAPLSHQARPSVETQGHPWTLTAPASWFDPDGIEDRSHLGYVLWWRLGKPLGLNHQASAVDIEDPELFNLAWGVAVEVIQLALLGVTSEDAEEIFTDESETRLG